MDRVVRLHDLVYCVASYSDGVGLYRRNRTMDSLPMIMEMSFDVV